MIISSLKGLCHEEIYRSHFGTCLYLLGNSRASKAIEPDSKEEIKNNIELALYKNASIHVIYGNRSFTGDIVKYDTERQRIIMKNFKRQVTSIINLEDIQKITLVPESVKTSQQQEKKLSNIPEIEKTHKIM